MRLKRSSLSLSSLTLLAIFGPVTAFTPWPSRPRISLDQCRLNILNHTLEYEPFLVAPNGERTFNTSEAMAIGTDYSTCRHYCGSSSSPFKWSVFSPQFTGWLLPFLALLAQLPYESDGTWHDFMALVLTVGSPQLAMYSLALTILNSRHLKQKLFDPKTLPYEHLKQLELKDLRKNVFQVLRLSQQEPFDLDSLNSHSTGEDNDQMITTDEIKWWKKAYELMNSQKRSFTASLATQTMWAIVTFAFTWVDAFGSTKIGTSVTAFGLAIALCWSWVAVIVLGWFFAGVSISKRPISGAVEQANERYPNISPALAPLQKQGDSNPQYFAFSRRIAGDAERSGPLYNYAKGFVWGHMANNIVEAIQQRTQYERSIANSVANTTTADVFTPADVAPSDSAPNPVIPASVSNIATAINSQTPTEPVIGEKRASIRRYLWLTEGWKRLVYQRMIFAAVSASALGIATIGAAFWLDFLTPSIGLGCRSGGILIYWTISYIVWILLVVSALISDHWSAHEATQRIIERQPPTLYGIGAFAVGLRLIGKGLALLNSAWIIIHCLFEFTSYYEQCFCATNRGTSPWIFLDEAAIRDLNNVQERWFGFATLTGAVSAGYIIFIGWWTSTRLQA